MLRLPHYSYEKTFSAGTTEDDQEELEMPCAWGILCDVDIAFRHGTDRKCKVHIDDGLHQAFPTNPEANYAFDGFTLHIADEYELPSGTRKIYLRGWNEGVHPHTVAVSFRVKLPQRLTKTEQALVEILQYFQLLLGQLPAETEETKEEVVSK